MYPFFNISNSSHHPFQTVPLTHRLGFNAPFDWCTSGLYEIWNPLCVSVFYWMNESFPSDREPRALSANSVSASEKASNFSAISLICETVISCEETLLLCLRDLSSCLASGASSLPPSPASLHVCLFHNVGLFCPFQSLFPCYILISEVQQSPSNF